MPPPQFQSNQGNFPETSTYGTLSMCDAHSSPSYRPFLHRTTHLSTVKRATFHKRATSHNILSPHTEALPPVYHRRGHTRRIAWCSRRIASRIASFLSSGVWIQASSNSETSSAVISCAISALTSASLLNVDVTPVCIGALFLLGVAGLPMRGTTCQI